MEDFYVEESARYALSSHEISGYLEHILRTDTDGTAADRQLKEYYRKGGELVWIDRLGIDSRADTLIGELHRRLTQMGFRERAFRVDQIEDDLTRMRSLDFDDGANSASHVAARLEYNLSKAYLRYVIGQRYGFTNPVRLLNRLDATAVDSTGKALGYRSLFDVAMEQPGSEAAARALQKVRGDSVGEYLSEVLPRDSVYQQMQRLLATADGAQRTRVLVNMERRRWREAMPLAAQQRYVVVNVAAYHLWAVSPDTIVDMRAACGACKTKTPLLTSRITHMEVNPQWIMPFSIVQNDVARHAGDSAYFARHRYFITEKSTGRRMAATAVSRQMLLGGGYRVTQEGGVGNALGRIIFRFPNDYSVFLHDTSSPGVFNRDDRGVSHGCVRVQRPFDLARFLIGDEDDEWELDKLRITMGLAPESDRGREYVGALEPDAPQPRLISWRKVDPRVPLYITYYTLFPVPRGELTVYPDVYGYDKALAGALAAYTK